MASDPVPSIQSALLSEFTSAYFIKCISSDEEMAESPQSTSKASA